MTLDEFREELNKALSHLYDLAFLETSLLTTLMPDNVGASAFAGASLGKVLRKAIIDAIESLRPPEGTPSDDAAWRPYRILEARYVAGLSHTDIEESLFLGKSQYYREHTRALEALSGILWRRWKPVTAAEAIAPTTTDPDALALAELAELARQEASQRVDLPDLLRDIAALLTSPESGRDVAILLQPEARQLSVYGSPGVLRQGLLLAISQAVNTLSAGAVYLDAQLLGREIVIHIQPEGAARADSAINHAMIQDFLRVAGGRAVLKQDHGSPSLELILPACLEDWTVLLVDNNSELADLFGRYLEGEPWTLVHAKTAQQALEICNRQPPSIILLDVLMPHRDGWALLSQLKAAPATARIPVVICSVLNQPQLAVSLGAVGYLRKPVRQQDLCAALDHWACPPQPAG